MSWIRQKITHFVFIDCLVIVVLSDIRLDWETYNIEPDDDQLLDLLVFVGRPLPVLKDGLEVEPTVDQQEEDEQPFIQVKLREHEGKSSNRPFEVTPSQQVCRNISRFIK